MKIVIDDKDGALTCRVNYFNDELGNYHRFPTNFRNLDKTAKNEVRKVFARVMALLIDEK